MTLEEMMQQRQMDDALMAAIGDVNSAFLWANRALDTTKEAVWIDFGLPFTSQFVHGLAHVNLERLDAFGNALHEHHIRQTYPATPALTETIEDVDKAFEIVVTIADEVDEALRRLAEATADGQFGVLALAAQDLMKANSADRTKVMQAWNMWANAPHAACFDSWMAHPMNGVMEVADDD